MCGDEGRDRKEEAREREKSHSPPLDTESVENVGGWMVVEKEATKRNGN